MISINRADRIWDTIDPQYQKLKKHASKKIRNKVGSEKRKFDKIRKKLFLVGISKVICMILLYISAFSAILPFLSAIANVAGVVTGLVGSGVLVAVLGFLTWIGNIYATDAQAIASYIIALTVKHDKTM